MITRSHRRHDKRKPYMWLSSHDKTPTGECSTEVPLAREKSQLLYMYHSKAELMLFKVRDMSPQDSELKIYEVTRWNTCVGVHAINIPSEAMLSSLSLSLYLILWLLTCFATPNGTLRDHMINHWSRVAMVSYEAVSITDRAIAQEDTVGLSANRHPTAALDRMGWTLISYLPILYGFYLIYFACVWLIW